jgi:hypothetical protein
LSVITVSREQATVLAAKGHGVDHQQPVAGQREDDRLKKVFSPIRANGQKLGRVGVWIDVGHHDRMLDRVADVLVSNAVTASRAVNFHTSIMYYIIGLAGNLPERGTDSRPDTV